jgi:TfoX/Sxy family transcriptional regulator of competence genes
MAYDEQLAARIREAVAGEEGLSEKRMFGGLAFLVHGNMAVAASGQGGLMLRVDPADADTHTAQEHVSRMVMRGREMAGWLRVADPALEDDQELQRWVDVGLAYAQSLPRK